jgi:ATP-dependent DNA helicase PIF1
MKSFSACDVRGRTDDGTRVTAAAATKLLDRLVVPGHLTLKVGAQVMLIKNLRQGVLVNGTLGRVLEFCTPEQATKTGTEISDEPDGQVGVVAECDNYAYMYVKRNGRVQKRSEKRENECVPYPLVLFENGRRMLCVSTDFDILNGSWAFAFLFWSIR